MVWVSTLDREGMAFESWHLCTILGPSSTTTSPSSWDPARRRIRARPRSRWDPKAPGSFCPLRSIRVNSGLFSALFPKFSSVGVDHRHSCCTLSHRPARAPRRLGVFPARRHALCRWKTSSTSIAVSKVPLPAEDSEGNQIQAQVSTTRFRRGASGSMVQGSRRERIA